MQAKNILSKMNELLIVVEKDHQGRILYTNTKDEAYYDKDNYAYFFLNGKYYRKELIGAENSTVYAYIDVTEYTKDYLTGLLNRFGFDIRIHHMNVDKRPFMIALCDIDFFKKVNDVYGHPVGDQVLKELSNVISTCIGEEGFISRYGGEEFIIAMKDFSLEQVSSKLEALRHRIENCTFRYGEHTFHTTLTIGFSVYDPHTGNIAESIDQADQAMYQGKIAGRNRVVPYKKE